MRIRRLVLVPVALLLALVPSSGFAQGTATSSITGVVVDADGGLIPGATVLVKSDTTGTEYHAVTSANGAFTVPAINIGTYTVTVSLQGFKTAVLKGVVVTAGNPATIRASLEVGGVTETVVVQGATEIIQTQSAVSSTTVNTRAITSLPVGSRSALDFAQFLPGVQTASSVRNSTVNGLPQSSISITLDGVNIQDNTLKTTDGFFAIVSPRLDAIEELTLTSAAQGAEASGQGGVQIKFTTRSGTNQFTGSAYWFFQDDVLFSNTYANRVRGLPKGEERLNQPGFRQGGPVYIPGVYDGRGKMFFFFNYEETRSPNTITTNSNLLLPEAQNGIFRYNGGPPEGINLYQLAASLGFTSTPDETVARLLQDIRTAANSSGGVFSPITGNLNTERYSFQQFTTSPVYYPTIRMDYNLTDMHRVSGTWYRQRFTDNGFDTTNTRQPTWPGFPVYGTQGSWREAYTGTFRSTLNQNIVNEARVAYSGAPVAFGPHYGLDMYRGPLANQNGYALGITALGITNAGPNFTPSARNATTLTIANTLNWLKGAHSIGIGGEFGQYDVWLDTYGSRAAPSISFGTQTGDPAVGMFTAANFPGSSSTDRNNAAALYGMLTGRVTQIGATARLTPDGVYVYQGNSRAEGRLRQMDFFVQDNWRFRPNLSLNLGLRYSIQLPFYAMNSSYSTATLNDVWGVSGYAPGCDMSNPSSATCNLFRPGVMTGQKPTYQNLGAGVEAYNTDWNNVAPSIGVNWTPRPSVDWLRRLLGDAGDSSFSAGFTRAYDRRGMNDFTGRFGNNPGLSITAARSTANGNLTVPLLFRDGYLGPPPTCPPLPAAKPTGCLLAAPEYPLSNQTATGSINTFDPDLQIPYSDTWTVAFQRGLGAKSAIEVRYIGTRSRQQWETFNYNEPNIIENGFLDEFKLAQANLQSHIAAGCGVAGGPVCSFAYRGPDTNTSPLPIYLAFFSGIPREFAGDETRYTASSWTSSSFINPLGLYDSNPFTPAGTSSTSGLAGDPQRQLNSMLAGLPANFFRVNPDMLGGANATGNRGFSKYNGLQLQYRRRLSDGLQFDANYTFSRAYASRHYSFRVDRLLIRPSGGEGDVTHGLKMTGVYELPFGAGRRFATDASPALDRLIGGWQVSWTSRLQSGRLFDIENVRVVGMSNEEAQELFRLRFASPTEIYSWPQDVIDETIKAFSVSATSPTGYGALGPPTGRYFAPANGPNCIETINNDYGQCGVRSLIVSGPPVLNFDLSLRKRVRITGRLNYEFSLDIFNLFNRVTFVPELGIGDVLLADWQAGLPNSSREMQIGTRFTW